VACRDAIDELRSLGGALSALPRARAPRSFALRESDARPQPAPAFRRWQPTVSGLAVASFAVFFLLVGVDVFDASTSSDDELTAGDAAGTPGQVQSADEDSLLEQPDTASDAEAGGVATPGRFAPGTQYDSESPPAQPTSPADEGAEEGEARNPKGFTSSPQPTAADEPAQDSGGGADGAADEGGDDGGGDTALRIAEAAAAAVALGASGTLAVAWWRRRAK
jgi:hypothetical protein